jgi:hypothetical protein
LLHTRLRTKRILVRQTDILHLLVNLSGNGANNSSGILGSVFSSKIMNKLDYTAAKKVSLIKPDVEMKDQTKST